jgi:hypothetical protein
LSEAEAVTEMVPEMVALLDGAVMDTVGAVVSASAMVCLDGLKNHIMPDALVPLVKFSHV